MKHLFTFFLFSIFSTHVVAQGTIQSLTVYPTNPTVNDEVVVYADIQFNYGGCPLDDQGMGLNGTDITAYAHHCVGNLTVICNTTDTFEIGQLPPGSYTFDFTLTSGQGGPNCTPGIVPDGNDQLQFTVSQSVGIDEVENLDGFAYPNPFVDVLNLKRSLSDTAIITDASGKRIAEIPSGTKQIDLSKLPNGIYVLHIGNSKLKLIKVS